MVEQEEKKQDRRVVKTKKAIRSAFVQLLGKKDVEKITIKELAETADVDRKTVYNYYNGVADILGELENEMVSDFQKEALMLLLCHLHLHISNCYYFYIMIMFFLLYLPYLRNIAFLH